MKYEIKYKNKIFKTIHFSNIDDKKCEELKKQFYELPDFKLIKKQMLSLMNGGKKTNYIIDYYLKKNIAKAKLSTSKWSIEEFWECNDLIRFAYGKIKNCSNFYKETDSDIKNIKTVLRLSPSGTAAKVSNFPYKTMLDIIKKYNINNNYYDYSCGWGIRLIASLANNLNYYGTDPNTELVNNLIKINDDFHKYTETTSKIDIRGHGSEIFIPEWKNKMGLVFSSPPYFDLEDYKIGEQSIKNRTYQDWLNDYWNKTVKNIKEYIIENGYFLLNIKNIKKYKLLDDMKNIILKNGFKYIESFELKNINRIFLEQNKKNNNEQILVFKLDKFKNDYEKFWS